MHAISQRKRPLNMCILYTITIISLFFFFLALFFEGVMVSKSGAFPVLSGHIY